MLLHEILDEYGQDGFNEVENAILSEIFAKNSIIAAGGSAVYGKDAMQNMKELGKIVYLKISYEELEHYLSWSHYLRIISRFLPANMRQFY